MSPFTAIQTEKFNRIKMLKQLILETELNPTQCPILASQLQRIEVLTAILDKEVGSLKESIKS